MTLPTTMLALIQKHDGYSGSSTGPVIDTLDPYLEAGEIPLPDLKEGQVLIRLSMAAVNPSDIHFIKGEYGQPRVKGAPAGFEGVGVIVDGYSDVERKRIGQRVAFASGRDGTGTWAEYAAATAATCIPVRDDMRDEDAAGHIVNPLTALAMFDLVVQSSAKSFLITAAGSQLGKLMIALGRDKKIAPIAVVRSASQKEALLALGAAAVLVETDADFEDTLRQAMDAHRPTVLLDAVGGQASADIFKAMPKRARWVVYGKLDPIPPRLEEMGQFVFMDKRIEGFWLAEWFRTASQADQMKAIGEVQERFVTGRWRTDVAAVLSLREAMEKLAPALSTRAGKVFLKP
jgi:NADPH:quinone reductase-like Zn-dependent oxidoreductase